MLPIIWEDDNEENKKELKQFWEKLPLDLINLIMKEYVFDEEDLEIACRGNDMKTIQFIIKHYKLNWNKGLLIGAKFGNIRVVKIMLYLGAKEKAKAYKYSQIYGYEDIKQFLKKFVD